MAIKKWKLPEKPECFIVDIIREALFLCQIPIEIKVFYIFKDEADRKVTRSTDSLMPGVGDIVGGGMRIRDFDELMAGYAREGIDPKHY